MTKEEFYQELKKIGIELTIQMKEQLNIYCEFLLEYNKHTNLTAITDQNQVYLKHFYDSLTIIKIINLNNQYICDIGTGAGFPGLVLKIVYPNLKVDLIDSTNKKCEFLKLLIKKLNLTNINVINARAEEYAKTHREIYDIVTSRAVAPLKHLLEYSIPLLKVNGYFVSLKSNISTEIININKYYQELSLTEEQIISFKLPIENSQRTLYKIKKTKPTHKKYPRQYSQIKKKEII